MPIKISYQYNCPVPCYDSYRLLLSDLTSHMLRKRLPLSLKRSSRGRLQLFYISFRSILKPIPQWKSVICVKSVLFQKRMLLVPVYTPRTLNTSAIKLNYLYKYTLQILAVLQLYLPCGGILHLVLFRPCNLANLLLKSSHGLWNKQMAVFHLLDRRQLTYWDHNVINPFKVVLEGKERKMHKMWKEKSLNYPFSTTQRFLFCEVINSFVALDRFNC